MPPDTYDQEFFDRIQGASRTAARRILPSLLELVPARSVVDIGCGEGVWLSVAQDLGVSEVLGVDGAYVDLERLAIPSSSFLARDLEQSVQLDRTFDLAICLEVGEHLSADRADGLVQDLTNLAPAVLFSAAIPFQGGTNHINEQWQSYWCAKFGARGYEPIDHLRKTFWHDLDAGLVYIQNALLYCRQDLIEASATLQQARESTVDNMIDVVHPKAYLSNDTFTSPDRLSFLRVAKALPLAARRSLARIYHQKLRRK